MFTGCSVFENCKTCNNGTWQAQDDFYIREQYCTDCRQGWSGGDCMSKFGCRLGGGCLKYQSVNLYTDLVFCTLDPEVQILFTVCCLNIALLLQYALLCIYFSKEWRNKDVFFCLACGGVIRRPQGHVTLESYPINARCEWIIYGNKGMTMDLRCLSLT